MTRYSEHMAKKQNKKFSLSVVKNMSFNEDILDSYILHVHEYSKWLFFFLSYSWSGKIQAVT